MSEKLIKILVPAVGGQGGGVLSEWIYQAFLEEGYEVQGISLPGLSQRGGSTVYYIEALMGGDSNSNIVFSQHPVPGDVDVIVAQEFLELGRVLEQGYGSEKTTIVTSTHRIYSTLEKLPVGSGIYSDDNLHAIAHRFSSQYRYIDALETARKNKMDEKAVNAILLGLLCNTGCLPLGRQSFINAIKTAGVAVEQNLKAFEAGFNTDNSSSVENKTEKYGYFETELLRKYKIKPDELKKLEDVALSEENDLPVHLHYYMQEALLRLADYQGVRYATEFADSVRKIADIDKANTGKDFRLTGMFLKNLALLMSYEDGIRVAELKIRENRFNKIREDMSLDEHQVFHVTEYLKPDAEEIYGLLPSFLVSPVLMIADMVYPPGRSGRKSTFTFAQTPVTSSFTGFLRMWLLTKLKPFRQYSYRFKKEHKVISKYIADVGFYSKYDYELGCLAARAGGIIKGYGRVRRRTTDTFYRFMDYILAELFMYERDISDTFDLTKSMGEKSLDLISADESGIEQAEKMTRGAIKERYGS